MKVAQSCPTLCDPMNYTAHGILQARILEWVAFPFSRGSTQPRNQTQVSCIAGGFFTSWATREEGFPSGPDGKQVCLQCGRPGFDSWVGKIAWSREWQPTLVFLPGKPNEPRSYTVHGVRHSSSTITHHNHNFGVPCNQCYPQSATQAGTT